MENVPLVDEKVMNLFRGDNKALLNYIEVFLSCTEEVVGDLADQNLQSLVEEIETGDLYLLLYIAALKYRTKPRFADLFRIVTSEASGRIPEEIMSGLPLTTDEVTEVQEH